jgi:hypothetical protein
VKLLNGGSQKQSNVKAVVLWGLVIYVAYFVWVARASTVSLAFSRFGRLVTFKKVVKAFLYLLPLCNKRAKLSAMGLELKELVKDESRRRWL